MSNNLLQRVTDKIVELVPDLLPDKDNLKFGDSFLCPVLADKLDKKQDSVFVIAVDEIINCDYGEHDGTEYVKAFYAHVKYSIHNVAYARIKYKDITLLPRTIRLADVMMAVEKHYLSIGKPYKEWVKLSTEIYFWWDKDNNSLETCHKGLKRRLASVLGVE